MRARSEPVRAFSNKDEAVRFAGRQLGGGGLRSVPQTQENLAGPLMRSSRYAWAAASASDPLSLSAQKRWAEPSASRLYRQKSLNLSGDILV